MTLTRDQELWGMALWVEKTHGDKGAGFIAAKIRRLIQYGEEDGARLWREVARRFEELQAKQSDSRPS